MQTRDVTPTQYAPNQAQHRKFVALNDRLSFESSITHIRLRKYMDLCATRALEGRQCNSALSTLVLNVLEAVDEIRNARQAEEETEAQGPKTRRLKKTNQ